MTPRYVKMSSKNQFTLPKSIVRRFPGTQYFEIVERDNEVVLRPARMTVHGETLDHVREKIRTLGISEAVVSEAVRSVRKSR